MPQYYLIPKALAQKVPALGRCIQSLEAGLFRATFWLLRRLSLRSATRLAASCFRLIGPLGDKAKKAKTNLAIAFPHADDQWIDKTTREIFSHLGVSAAELLKLEQIWTEREQRLEFVLQAGVKEQLDNKVPIVFVTAHVGAWQITNFFARQMGIKVSTVYAPESNPALAQMMLELRDHLGVGLIASDAGVRPLMKELNNGNSIGLAMDTRLDTGKLIPYFGRDALTNTTAARLALRTGAALVPINGVRLPNERFRITAYNPLVTDLAEDASVDERAENLTRQINRHFEDWIRATPEQWICLKRRWPKAHKL